jgi:hypothetical protein
MLINEYFSSIYIRTFRLSRRSDPVLVVAWSSKRMASFLSVHVMGYRHRNKSSRPWKEIGYQVPPEMSSWLTLDHFHRRFSMRGLEKVGDRTLPQRQAYTHRKTARFVTVIHAISQIEFFCAPDFKRKSECSLYSLCIDLRKLKGSCSSDNMAWRLPVLRKCVLRGENLRTRIALT